MRRARCSTATRFSPRSRRAPRPEPGCFGTRCSRQHRPVSCRVPHSASKRSSAVRAPGERSSTDLQRAEAPAGRGAGRNPKLLFRPSSRPRPRTRRSRRGAAIARSPARASQWSIDCQSTAREDGPLDPDPPPARLQQLLREAVANAVRHGRRRVDVGLGVDDDHCGSRSRTMGPASCRRKARRRSNPGR